MNLTSHFPAARQEVDQIIIVLEISGLTITYWYSKLSELIREYLNTILSYELKNIVVFVYVLIAFSVILKALQKLHIK